MRTRPVSAARTEREKVGIPWRWGSAARLPPGLLGALAMSLMAAGPGVARAAAAPPDSAQSATHLKRVQSSRVDALYVAPGASLSAYRKILIDPVDVTFEAGWMRRHPEVTSRNALRLRGMVSGGFSDVFVRELTRTGKYTVVYEPGPGVLRVHAVILNLDIAAPSDPLAESESRYVLSTGEMTLELELYDAQTGALLARAVDRKKGRETGSLQIVNADTNAAEARRAFTGWADALRDALDAARESPSKEPARP